MSTPPGTNDASPADDQGAGSWVANATGRAVASSARAAARAWRGPLEAVAEDVLSAPEVARVIDRTLAGPLPEEVVRSLVRNHVLERMAAELADSGELEHIVASALGSPRSLEMTDRLLASEPTQATLRHVASNPELRDAIARQTAGLADEVAGRIRASAIRFDDRAERWVRRRDRPAPVIDGGVATRSIAFAIDVAITMALFMSAVGATALVGSLVGGLRPAWLVGVLLATGWTLIAAAYFSLFWTTAGQTPGMRLLRLRVFGPTGAPPSVVRSLGRLLGMVLSIIPMFAGFVPILFTARRRGLADFMAGTVVVYADRVRDRRAVDLSMSMQQRTRSTRR